MGGQSISGISERFFRPGSKGAPDLTSYKKVLFDRIAVIQYFCNVLADWSSSLMSAGLRIGTKRPAPLVLDRRKNPTPFWGVRSSYFFLSLATTRCETVSERPLKVIDRFEYTSLSDP